MNKFFSNWAQGSDDPFNFLAFSVNKIEETAPYLNDWYVNLLQLWGSYDLEVRMFFILASVLLVGLLIYIIFKAIGSMKDNRNVHPHHLAGFGGDEK